MPGLYDLLSASMFAPFGGLHQLRTRALDLAGIGPGTRVLEPGCGTGGLTALMVARGAVVHAIDGSERMLGRARAAAPDARFTRMRLEELQVSDDYDVALFAFVLHELPVQVRAELLATALLAAQRIVILDHAVPRSYLLGGAWRRFLTALEPPSVGDCIIQGYRSEIEAAGGEVAAVHALAGGTAALTLATPTKIPLEAGCLSEA